MLLENKLNRLFNSFLGFTLMPLYHCVIQWRGYRRLIPRREGTTTLDDQTDK